MPQNPHYKQIPGHTVNMSTNRTFQLISKLLCEISTKDALLGLTTAPELVLKTSAVCNDTIAPRTNAPVKPIRGLGMRSLLFPPLAVPKVSIKCAIFSPPYNFLLAAYITRLVLTRMYLCGRSSFKLAILDARLNTSSSVAVSLTLLKENELLLPKRITSLLDIVADIAISVPPLY
jgi:hypothetical protein